MMRARVPGLIVAIVMILLVLGIVILASASSVRGETYFLDAQYFLKRQLIWLGVALFICALCARIDYHVWRKLAFPIGLLSIFLLVIVLIPGIGVRIGGSRRWLHLGPVSLQPSEAAKLATVILFSAWMALMGPRMRNLKEGLLLPLMALGLFCGLIFLEPDFGTTALIGMVGMLLLYLGGTRIWILGIIALLGLAGFVVAVIHDPVRLGRVLAFLRPDLYPAVAYHLGQSKDAFSLGGFAGRGLGESIQKHFYLPEAHTDFILAIIGEELGVIATVGVALLFLGLMACGFFVARQTPDPFGRHLAVGITLMHVIQAGINIGVVTGAGPTKGIPLPFISYGGSSLIIALAGIGILVNIARQALAFERDDETFDGLDAIDSAKSG
jgi:cell division protein FtsW